MALTEYRRKRNFRVTSEPKGGKIAQHDRLSFVIQKHAASHLHYDFRLEIDGVLKSWAVPKGPSLDPAVKRLAMHVEDHPLEYGKFEGIIPKGEYGGGTVLLWDAGTWEPVGDAKTDYRNGSMKFILHGEKLRGQWMLVRKGGRSSGTDERHWFLFKEKDKYSSSIDITAKSPLSVTTGRDLETIAEESDRVWGREGEIQVMSKRKKSIAQTKSVKSNLKSKGRKSKKQQNETEFSAKIDLNKIIKTLGVSKTSAPKKSQVQLATLVSDPPSGDKWIHEIKLDGYRMLCYIDDGNVRFVSRNGNDWTNKFPKLCEVASDLDLKSAVLDGEVVIMQPDGRTSFQALQNAFENNEKSPFSFYIFDLLHLNGYDIASAPLIDRKALLQQIIPNCDTCELKYSDHVVGDGAQVFAEASKLQLEGIISKRSDRPYQPGRGLDWVKVKCSLEEEFVIGGFTPPGGSRSHFGALALGYYNDKKELLYAGRVGTGFDQSTLSMLHKKFTKLMQKQSPFADLSGNTGEAREVTWLKPELVAQIAFSSWTDGKHLRHPAFLGLREDKTAKQVIRDKAVAPPAVDSSRKANSMSKRKTSGKELTSISKPGDIVASEVAGVQLSHPDKILYPDDGITKIDLANYYELVSEWMLPHVENRLISLVRCPAGCDKHCFFQKHPAENSSDSFRRFKVEEKHKSEDYIALYELKDIIALVQMGVLEIHLWGSQAADFEKPDRLIFDLDPDPAVKWPQVITAAKEVKLLLEQLELESFLKTTGGKGLHIVVPIRRTMDWKDAKAFCHAVADFLEAAAPDRYIAKMSKAARKGKIFVDYLRNDRGATAIAPYSTRARAGASVSVPIRWEELDAELTSNYFTVRNIGQRLSKLKKDPWADISKTKQSVTAAMLKKLQVPK